VRLLKNFPTFYGIRSVITVFRRALHYPLSWAKSMQSKPSQPLSLRSILRFLILFITCGLVFPLVCFLLVFSPIFYTHSSFHIRVTCPVNLIQLDLRILITLGEEYRDRLCGLVVRVLRYRSGDTGSIPGTTRKKSSGSGTGSTQPSEYNWGATWLKSSGSCLENREYGCRDPSRWPRGTLYPQKLAITSLTSGGRSVGIVRSRTQTMEFLFFLKSTSYEAPHYEVSSNLLSLTLSLVHIFSLAPCSQTPPVYHSELLGLWNLSIVRICK
jgi:hypothetical protein